MRYREYKPEDRPALEAMHAAQGFDYEFPDVDDPRHLWITRMVITNESGRPTQAILGKLTSEAFYIEDSNAHSIETRVRRFLTLQHIAENDGKQAGMDSVHIWLPPELEKTFG